ncbi:MAG: protein translocase subunit SecF [Candidatus Nealsonbacteria bacterium]|nr:MAG: protein translocase subunit SecF [Candidatus Nealsonbacteria bacterium]
MYIPFIKHRKIFYSISVALVILALLSIFLFGLKLGIDFTGGSSLEIVYQSTPPSSQEIKNALKDLNLGEIIVQKSGERGVILKMKDIDEETHQKILEKLKKLGEVEEGSESFQSIGPTIGRELKQKTKIVVSLALIAILVYIAFSFRRVSKPVKSYIYGITSLIALCHDVLIPLGIFAILGKFYGVEITIPIITAFLTVFGYSINDSVVVFDRVRENLLKASSFNFELTVEKSLNQTLTRSLYTSLTTLLVLFAIFLFGGETLKYFSLALILGIGFGTYSSLFLATPLLVSYYLLKENRYK